MIAISKETQSVGVWNVIRVLLIRRQIINILSLNVLYVYLLQDLKL